MNENEKKSRLVFDMRVCRKLLQRGHRVIDVKPLKTDKNRSVLIFEVTEKFNADLAELTAEYKEKDTPKDTNEAAG